MPRGELRSNAAQSSSYCSELLANDEVVRARAARRRCRTYARGQLRPTCATDGRSRQCQSSSTPGRSRLREHGVVPGPAAPVEHRERSVLSCERERVGEREEHVVRGAVVARAIGRPAAPRDRRRADPCRAGRGTTRPLRPVRLGDGPTSQPGTRRSQPSGTYSHSGGAGVRGSPASSGSDRGGAGGRPPPIQLFTPITRSEASPP